MANLRFEFWNEDATKMAKQRIQDESVDLVFTDPPFAIADPKQVYNRDESLVVGGYIEVPKADYPRFTKRWVAEVERVLRPGGALMVVSGYTHLDTIMETLRASSLYEVNHIIWKYNFGVYTTRKFVSSHYHLLYWARPPDKLRTFNRFSRFTQNDRDSKGSTLYRDMEDVWVINREYKPGEIKNKNVLPEQLVLKVLQYCSSPGDLVCDLFLGSFAIARIAKGMWRSCIGFELNKAIFDIGEKDVEAMVAGDLLKLYPSPAAQPTPVNHGKPWTDADLVKLESLYDSLRDSGMTKAKATANLCRLFGRGRFSVTKALKKLGK
jgi:site-specific DNA-methyltransferase (adenine-specific)